MADATITHDRVEELTEQVADLDSETLYAMLTVVADGIDRTIEEDLSFGSSEFQSVYDDVRNDERMIREAQSPDFRLAEGIDQYEQESVALALVRGEMDFQDILPQTERADVDFSEWVRSGKKLYRRFAVKFRENVCTDPSVGGSLDRAQLITAIALILTTLLVGSIYAPIAVIIATIIVNSGLDTYCPDRPPQ